MEDNPFPGLQLTPSDFLDEVKGRSTCPKCAKSRKYYCYTCYVPVTGLEDKVPKVKLPIKVDIIKHPNECDGKSTAAHAGVVAPGDVRVYTYPVIPDYEDKTKTLLVFPGENSITLEEIHRRTSDVTLTYTADHGKTSELSCGRDDFQESTGECSPCDNQADNKRKSPCPADGDGCSTCDSTGQHQERPNKKRRGPKCRPFFDRVVFIDSTWNQTKKIQLDERLRDLQTVELKTRQTKFWRHQRDKPDSYLATIEAIYYFLFDYHQYFIDEPYRGQYDDLLFFFCFMYQKIKKLYDGGKELKAYKQQQKAKQKQERTATEEKNF